MTPKSLIAPARLARRPVLATQSDGRLVDLVRAGYEPAFEAIVARYRGALLRYVERFLPRERAEDAVQQSFVNAYEAILRDDSDLELRPWLYRIAHNAALNALRDRALRHSELPDGLDGVERPDEVFERVQGLRELLTAVQALPGRQRDAIVLRELEGRSYEEIAVELRVSDGSVRQLLHRARNTLREAATAVTPAGLIARMPWAAPAEPVAARVAELCGAGAGGAVVAKLCATALVTGAVAGGVAVAPEGDGGADRAVGPERAAAREGAGAAERSGASGRGGGDSGVAGELASGETVDRSGGRVGGRESDRAAGDRSGPGGGGGDRSGPGGGEDDATDNSGPGSSGDGSSGSGSGSSGSGSDNSGPGSGSSGSGHSGSGSSGSGSGSSGSGSGDSGSGSDNSGSGSGSSGSGSDGSGSGSDSSGSGSGDSSGSGSSGSGSDSDPVTLDSDDSSGSGSSGSGSDSSGSGSSGSG